MAKKSIPLDEEGNINEEKFKKFWADFGANFHMKNMGHNERSYGSTNASRERSLFRMKLHNYSTEYYVRDSLPFHPFYGYNRHKK